MRRNRTAVVARNEIANGTFDSEPWEVARAIETIFLCRQPHPGPEKRQKSSKW